MIKAIIIYLVTLAALGLAAYLSWDGSIASVFCIFSLVGGGGMMIACVADWMSQSTSRNEP